MKTRKSFALLGIALIFLVTLACAIGEETQPQAVNAATKIAQTVAAIDAPAGQVPAAPVEATALAPQASAPQVAAPTLAPSEPPSLPTSLQSTLASLDSYRFMLKYHKTGKKPADTTIIEVTMDRDDKADAVHSIYTLQNPIKLSDTEADTEPSTAEIWSSGDVTCTKDSDGKYESKEQKKTDTDNTKDLLDLLDIVPRIDNPEFVGAETVNGIASNHFRFKIANYMADSGWLVTRNEGEYWLAQDGQFIVKYSLYLDASSAPEASAKADIIKVFISEELQNINQPVNIKLPSGCPPPSSD
jgi:hypothetical protein